jgi:transcriptional regulator with XRE-family HTH domain
VVVHYPPGRYVLQGGGITAYQWVWIPNPSSAPLLRRLHPSSGETTRRSRFGGASLAGSLHWGPVAPAGSHERRAAAAGASSLFPPRRRRLGQPRCTSSDVSRSSGSQMRILGVGKRIRQIRHRLGLTQAQFAQRLGVIKVSVARYEAGRVPRPRVLEDIAQLGGVTVTSLLQGPEEETTQRTFPSVLTELGVSDVLSELVPFLEARALIMNRLPGRHRNQYKERIRESISRMKRDLVEYQALLEVSGQRRSPRRGNLTRPKYD